MSDSCCSKPSQPEPSACCGSSQKAPDKSESSSSQPSSCCPPKEKVDYLLWGGAALVLAGLGVHGAFSVFSDATAAHMAHADMNWLQAYGHGVYEIFRSMLWGLVLGIFMVAVLAKVPRDFVLAILGSKRGFKGIFRATMAGVLLDLCSHGILMVGAKLYERGASIGQVMAFLIASPWNSFSLTLVLVAMIGLNWTLAYIFLSLVVAIVTGLIFDALVARKTLPDNPNRSELDPNFKFWAQAKAGIAKIKFSKQGFLTFLVDGVRESRMVIRWLFVGVVIAALLRTFISADSYESLVGPTILGLMLTIVAATIIEVCSEGSAPIAADIVNRANAPGNGFAFLMAGVATDYTEVMVIKDTTKSWKIALMLPVIALPQVILIAILIQATF